MQSVVTKSAEAVGKNPENHEKIEKSDGETRRRFPHY